MKNIQVILWVGIFALCSACGSEMTMHSESDAIDVSEDQLKKKKIFKKQGVINDGITQEVAGCTVADAGNYDAAANADDGSCTFNSGEAFNQSTLQAFYFFREALVDGVPLTADDWILSFTSDGETLVGARRWDTSLCGGGICELPAMGDDDSWYSVNYMSAGEVPRVKIYDASAGKVYETQTSEALQGFQNLLLQIMDEISAIVD